MIVLLQREALGTRKHLGQDLTPGIGLVRWASLRTLSAASVLSGAVLWPRGPPKTTPVKYQPDISEIHQPKPDTSI